MNVRDQVCTHAQVNPSTTRCVGADRAPGEHCRRRPYRGWACVGSTEPLRLVAFWCEVIATAATWHAEAGDAVGPVVAWLAVLLLWRERLATVGELAAAADACRSVAAWRLVAAVRAATCVAWRWERVRGGVPWRVAMPFPSSIHTPTGFGLAVLDAAAGPFGLASDDAAAEWCELVARHRVEVVSC